MRSVWTYVHTEGIAAKQQRTGLVMSDTVSDYQRRLLRPSHWPSAVMDRFRPVIHRDGRVAHHVVGRFLRNPDNPTLVSFPRTGSHWFRLICEEYFLRPTLVRVLTRQRGGRFLFIHTHDNDLRVRRANVLYLYRDPGPTVFSQMKYMEEPLEDEWRVRFWGRQYAAHLKKWLLDEDFTRWKTVLRYERLRSRPMEEFAKVTGHFNEPLDEERLRETLSVCSKNRIQQFTESYDAKVIKQSEDYEDQRARFLERFEPALRDVLREIDPRLPDACEGD